jgi:hypothetical protein
MFNQCTPAIEELQQTGHQYGTPSRDKTYSIIFQQHCPEYLTANGRYCYSFPKGVHLDQIQKQIFKRAACLPQYIDVHAVGLEFFLITQRFPFLLLVPIQKLGSLIA